jgi:hypothetical protein
MHKTSPLTKQAKIPLPTIDGWHLLMVRLTEHGQWLCRALEVPGAVQHIASIRVAKSCRLHTYLELLQAGASTRFRIILIATQIVSCTLCSQLLLNHICVFESHFFCVYTKAFTSILLSLSVRKSTPIADDTQFLHPEPYQLRH